MRHPRLSSGASRRLVEIGVIVVPSLIAELTHKNGRERSTQTLVKIGEPAVPFLFRAECEIPPITVLNHAKDKTVVAELHPVTEALLRMPPAVLLAAYAREGEDTRRNLINRFEVQARILAAAGKVADERAVNFLASVYEFEKECEALRRAAWDALVRIAQDDWEGTPSEALRIFTEHTKAADPRMRIEAASALCWKYPKKPEGRYGFAEAIGIALAGENAYILSPRPEARHLILTTVADVFNEAGAADARLLAHDFFTHRLRTGADAAMLPDLIRLVEYREDSYVNAKAAELMGADARAAVPALHAWIRRANNEDLGIAVTTLRRIGLAEPGVIEAQLDAAADSNWTVCSSVIQGFRQYGRITYQQRERLLEAIYGNKRLLQDSPGNEYALRNAILSQARQLRPR